MKTIEVGTQLNPADVEEFEGVHFSIAYGASGPNPNTRNLTFGFTQEELDIMYVESVQQSLTDISTLQKTLPVIQHPPESPFYIFLRDTVLDTREDAERAARLGLLIVSQSNVYEHRSLLEIDKVSLRSHWRKVGHVVLPPLFG